MGLEQGREQCLRDLTATLPAPVDPSSRQDMDELLVGPEEAPC